MIKPKGPYPTCGTCGHLWSDHYGKNESCGFVSADLICDCKEYQ